jgi:hypothetical protein
MLCTVKVARRLQTEIRSQKATVSRETNLAGKVSEGEQTLLK